MAYIKYQTDEKIRLKFEAIKEEKSFWKGQTVLDIGCNEGLLLPLLEEQGIRRYAGIDTSPDYIVKARLNFPEADFRMMDLFKWNENVDIAISLSTFHILNDKDFEKAVKHYSNVCRVLIMEYPVKGNAPIYHVRTELETYKIVAKYFDNCVCYGVSPSPHDPTGVRKVFRCY